MKTLLFGRLPSGEPVHAHELAAPSGFTCTVMDYGATVTRIHAVDSEGALADVALGFSTLEPYLQRHPYIGSLVGRVAGRITAGTFMLHGLRYSLDLNDPPNHLHGGRAGFDRRLWTAERDTAANAVRFTHVSPDGEEGYPGTVTAHVTYRVTADDALHIELDASTDRPTPVNLTSHVYFNLRGEGSGTVEDHRLRIAASGMVPASHALTLQGTVVPVDGRPDDFRTPTRIGDRLGQLLRSHGSLYVLDRPRGGELTNVAQLVEPFSGRTLEVLTTEPMLQFYSGALLDKSFHGKAGRPYGRFAGCCLEAHRYPDAVNRRELFDTVIEPGPGYRATTVYRFSTAPPIL